MTSISLFARMAAVLLVAAAGALPAAAWACSCSSGEPRFEGDRNDEFAVSTHRKLVAYWYLDRARASLATGKVRVYSGRIVSADEIEPRPTDEEVLLTRKPDMRFRFRVSEVWAGPVERELMVLDVSYKRSVCGKGLDKSHRHLVEFFKRADGTLSFFGFCGAGFFRRAVGDDPAWREHNLEAIFGRSTPVVTFPE